MTERIPLVDLGAQYAKLKPEIWEAMDRVFESKAFIQGPFVEQFEREFCAKIGAEYGMGCSNGTSAISLALEALGVGRGDEVITTTLTFFASAEAICHVGATPVFVDVDPSDYTMDPHAFEAAITPLTRAVLPVHLYGTLCNMEAINHIAASRKLKVVEDAAQAHMASYKGRFAGTLGDCATFSFYPGKNLGAYGDAGFVTATSPEVMARMRQLRDHGRRSKYEHDIVGYNQRMDGLQGAILSVKLRYLEAWTKTRQENARHYDERLVPAGFKTIRPRKDTMSSYHLYVVEVSNRDEVMKALDADGIDSGIHYPIPLHLQPAFAELKKRRNSLPNAEHAAKRVLSLPMCAELSEGHIDRICDVFLQCAKP